MPAGHSVSALGPSLHFTQALEHFLGRATDRTAPVVRQVLKLHTLRNLVFAVALVGVVDVAAVSHLALPHITHISHRNPPFRCPLQPRKGRLFSMQRYRNAPGQATGKCSKDSAERAITMTQRLTRGLTELPKETEQRKESCCQKEEIM